MSRFILHLNTEYSTNIVTAMKTAKEPSRGSSRRSERSVLQLKPRRRPNELPKKNNNAKSMLLGVTLCSTPKTLP